MPEPLERASRLVGFVCRTAVTIWLLALVYQGSRVALVISLGLIGLGMEVHHARFLDGDDA